MSWLTKLLPPKIKREQGQRRSNLPEGLWSKCPSCEAVLYATDLENNLQVCPKCGHHNRLNSRQRLDLLLDAEGRFEIGAEVVPVDSLKFKDSKKYPDRLMEANEATGESDSLVVMQGAIKTMPVVAAAFEFEFMGGSMGSVLGERFVRGVQNAVEQKMPFICITASGGARMQEGLFSLMQMAKTTAALTKLSEAGQPFILFQEGFKVALCRRGVPSEPAHALVGAFAEMASNAVEHALSEVPPVAAFERFQALFERYSREAGKEQYLVPYFIAAHPGTTDEDMLELSLWMKRNGLRADQVQAFLPSPMALATTMYHSGKNPLHRVDPESTDVHVPRGGRVRRLHKAFLRYHDAENWPLLREALRRMGRADLIGNGRHQLVPSWQPPGTGQRPEGTRGPGGAGAARPAPGRRRR